MAGIDRAGLLDFTRALVRIPSVFDPSRGLNEAPAADLVAERMRGFGWTPVVQEVAPGRPNVHAVIEGGRTGPTLLFEGHTDVVTEGDPAAWSHPPFGAEIVAGRLYGRGAADMKAGVGAMLYAIQALASGGPFPGRVVVAALCDEEGLMLGVKAFVRAGHAAGVDAAIVCEPEGGEVCVTQKGALRLRVTAAGKMAHGAMPQHGHNPIPPLARFVERAAAVEAELQRERGEHPQLGWDYITPTVLAAGTAGQANVIPASAWAALDVRTTPGLDHRALVARLRAQAPGLEVEVVEDRPPTETSPSHPVVQAVMEAHRRVTGLEPVLGGVPGATDGTILWRDARVPIVIYGPGGKWIAHQVDEYVEVSDLARAADVYLEAARLFLGLGAGGGY
ncbi:MAG: M20 family metallopeptidase [Candidatus Dormibacteraeota bacterium]|nr:M20 family metallopeptidase [Candidatus Dormibacteraeota bacterium]